MPPLPSQCGCNFNRHMEFSGFERSSAKSSEEQTMEEELEDLREKHRMLDLEKGLDEWHIEHLQEKEQAHGIDHLTGVDTRKAFEAKLKHALDLIEHGQKEEHRHGPKSVTDASLIFIDLDQFKEVNDSLGHSRGDSVLQRAASLLRGALREEEALGRWGGDEFVVLLLNADERNALAVAEKLRVALESDPKLHTLGVTGSFGVCSSSASGATSPETLIQNADEAVYAAKHGGRNRVEAYHRTQNDV